MYRTVAALSINCCSGSFRPGPPSKGWKRRQNQQKNFPFKFTCKLKSQRAQDWKTVRKYVEAYWEDWHTKKSAASLFLTERDELADAFFSVFFMSFFSLAPISVDKMPLDNRLFLTDPPCLLRITQVRVGNLKFEESHLSLLSRRYGSCSGGGRTEGEQMEQPEQSNEWGERDTQTER